VQFGEIYGAAAAAFFRTGEFSLSSLDRPRLVPSYRLRQHGWPCTHVELMFVSAARVIATNCPARYTLTRRLLKTRFLSFAEQFKSCVKVESLAICLCQQQLFGHYRQNQWLAICRPSGPVDVLWCPALSASSSSAAAAPVTALR